MTAPTLTLGPVSVTLYTSHNVEERIDHAITSRQPAQLVTLNALMLNEAFRNADLSRAISSASIIVPDSIGIVWAIKQLTGIRVSRLAGIDLVDDMCRWSAQKSYRVFFLGSRAEVVSRAVKNIRAKYPAMTVCGMRDGYFSDKDEPSVINEVRAAKPDVLFVGFAIPRQEIWISQKLQELKVPIVMGVGGSFDVLSNQLFRSPRWMQVVGLEWFFRLVQQPWRIARIAALPGFVWSILHLKSAAPAAGK